MATSLLGETIDIHAGGQDLEFPHHENEIAQSEAKTGKPFANYWLHNGYLTVGDNGEKMSKSLGNFVTAHDFIENNDPEVIRFALATTQYRRPIPFNDSTLTEAETNLQKIRIAYDNLQFRQTDSLVSGENDEQLLAELALLETRFTTEMDDDFNAANGITVIYELVKWVNQYSQEAVVSQVVSQAALRLLTELLAIFGVELASKETLLRDEAIDQLIIERDQARAAKQFARSDEIRDLFKAQGIILEDTAQGTRWRRQ